MATLSKAQQRKARRKKIRDRHRRAVLRGIARQTDVLEGRKGPWGYRLTADQDIDERGCPLCFRNYSDYEMTAVVPCWQCRDEVSLDSCGSLEQDSPYVVDDFLAVVATETLDRFEFEADEWKIDWRIEGLRRAVVRLRRFQAEVVIEDAKPMSEKSSVWKSRKRILKRYERDVCEAREALQAAKNRSGDLSAAFRLVMHQQRGAA